MASILTLCSKTLLAFIVYIFTATFPIGTCGFSIKLTPIDSVLFPKNLTLEQRHHIRVEISRNRVLNLMSSAKGAPNGIQPYISRALSNYYVSQVLIGSRQYKPYLMVDSGADETWVQCAGCTNCFPLKGGNFEYKASSTYHNVACSHPLCVPKMCSSNGLCLYSLNYTLTGGRTTGWFSTDIFGFSSSIKTMLYPVAFGCGYDNRNITFGLNDGPNNLIAGHFGLGAGPRSFLTQLANQTNMRFSYCLPSWTTRKGTYTFLRFGNDAVISGRVQTTRLVPAGIPRYHLNVLGISLAGKRLKINPALFRMRIDRSGGFVIDTGSPYTYLAQTAYATLREEMVQYVMKRYKRRPIPKRPGQMLDLCYRSLPFGTFTIPSMTYHFQGADLVLDSSAIFERTGTAVVCMGILPTSDAGPSVLGAFQQANYRFLFHVRNLMMSFAPEKCQNN